MDAEAVAGLAQGESALGAVQQTQVCSSAYGLAPVGDSELGVDVLGVGPHRVHRHAELAGDGRPRQVAVEQPEYVELAFAERVEKRMPRRGRPGGRGR